MSYSWHLRNSRQKVKPEHVRCLYLTNSMIILRGIILVQVPDYPELLSKITTVKTKMKPKVKLQKHPTEPMCAHENVEWDVVIKVSEHRTWMPWYLILVEHEDHSGSWEQYVWQHNWRLRYSWKLRKLLNGILSWDYFVTHNDSCYHPCFMHILQFYFYLLCYEIMPATQRSKTQ